MNALRGTLIFIFGALAGLLLDLNNGQPNAEELSDVQSESGDPDIVMLNHIGITVNDMEDSLEFYTKAMGLEEVFTLRSEEGQLGLAYLTIGKNTFVELTPASDVRPIGISHIGIQVADIESVKANIEARGGRLTDLRRVFGTNEIVSYLIDPQGVPIELAEYPVDSAMRNVLVDD